MMHVFSCRQVKRNDDLQETAAADLHLAACPFATGWSGNIVRGRIGCHRVAVKLAPILSVRAEVNPFSSAVTVMIHLRERFSCIPTDSCHILACTGTHK